MAKIKLKDERNRALVGKAIFNAWDSAIKNNPEAPVIDRRALIASLSELMDLKDTGKSGRTIEFDVVFDTDLDANTRLVWLSIPTPETEAIGGRDTWAKWKQDYYDNLTPEEKAKKEEELGHATLFGCGR